MHHHSKPYEHLQLCVQQITHQFISKYCCNAVLCRCSAYVMTALECSTCSKEVCAPAGRCNDKTRVDQSEGFVSLCKCVLRVSMCFACPRWCLLGAQFTLDVAQRKRCRCWLLGSLQTKQQLQLGLLLRQEKGKASERIGYERIRMLMMLRLTAAQRSRKQAQDARLQTLPTNLQRRQSVAIGCRKLCDLQIKMHYRKLGKKIGRKNAKKCLVNSNVHFKNARHV